MYGKLGGGMVWQAAFLKYYSAGRGIKKKIDTFIHFCSIGGLKN